MANRLKQYLQDPFLNHLYGAVRQAGRLQPISVDLTHLCNLRCQGCYFFAEQMDRFEAPVDETRFDDFVSAEKARGTNFVTVVGGEPSLVLHRLKKIYDNFWMNVATNGLRKIPLEGFENLPIGIAVWGDRASDRELRGEGRRDVFARALENYRDDPRAFWYYTVAAGKAQEVEGVVERCVENGNRVLFNFYGDLSGAGGDLDHRQGFAQVRRQVDRMIERYPDKILMTSYLSRVVTTGRLYDQEWGWDVCTSVTSEHPVNAVRIRNGNPYNPHFRAYNADLVTTRRCCTGEDRDCTSCFDVWEHFSWIMSNLRQHLDSKAEFTNWLAVMYLFYLVNRIVDFESGIQLLPEIHRRAGRGLETDSPATSWRYLTSDSVDAAEGLAGDEAMMLAYGRDTSARVPPSLRLYTYRPHCALVGRYQNLEDEVDLDYCAEHDIQVGRRPTGGGAIIMGPGQLGVAIAGRAPADEAARETLRRYAEGVIAGLASIGITARFRSKNDLEVSGRKIAGLGLYRDPRGAVLFHASVLVDLDVELMLAVLRIPGAKLSDKMVAHVGERVTTVSRELQRRRTAVDVRPAFSAGVAAAFGIDLQPGELDAEESLRLAELVRERYSTREWRFQRSPRRDSRGSSLLKTPVGLLRIHIGVHGGVVKSAMVTGDYNTLPPGIQRLEAALRWCKAEREQILETALSALDEGDLGVPPTDVAEAVWEAARRGLQLPNASHPHREGACYFPEVGTRQEEKA